MELRHQSIFREYFRTAQPFPCCRTLTAALGAENRASVDKNKYFNRTNLILHLHVIVSLKLNLCAELHTRKTLFHMEIYACRTCTDCEYRSSWQYSRLGVWRVSHQQSHCRLTVYSMSPIFQVDNVFVLRTDLVVPQTRLRTVGDRAFCVAAAKTWNSLPSEATPSATLLTFKHELKTYLFTVISRHVISPRFFRIDVQWFQCFCICSLKFLIDWLIDCIWNKTRTCPT